MARKKRNNTIINAKKLFYTIIFECILAALFLFVIIFKLATNNVFFPKISIIIVLWAILGIYLAIGIWYNKL